MTTGHWLISGCQCAVLEKTEINGFNKLVVATQSILRIRLIAHPTPSRCCGHAHQISRETNPLPFGVSARVPWFFFFSFSLVYRFQAPGARPINKNPVSHPLGGQRDDSRLFTFQTSCKQHPLVRDQIWVFQRYHEIHETFWVVCFVWFFFFEKILIVFCVVGGVNFNHI